MHNNKLELNNTWLTTNKLSLIAGKTKIMMFHKKQKYLP